MEKLIYSKNVYLFAQNKFIVTIIERNLEFGSCFWKFIDWNEGRLKTTGVLEHGCFIREQIWFSIRNYLYLIGFIIGEQLSRRSQQSIASLPLQFFSLPPQFFEATWIQAHILLLQQSETALSPSLLDLALHFLNPSLRSCTILSQILVLEHLRHDGVSIKIAKIQESISRKQFLKNNFKIVFWEQLPNAVVKKIQSNRMISQSNKTRRESRTSIYPWAKKIQKLRWGRKHDQI